MFRILSDFCLTTFYHRKWHFQFRWWELHLFGNRVQWRCVLFHQVLMYWVHLRYLICSVNFFTHGLFLYRDLRLLALQRLQSLHHLQECGVSCNILIREGQHLGRTTGVWSNCRVPTVMDLKSYRGTCTTLQTWAYRHVLHYTYLQPYYTYISVVLLMFQCL